MVRLAFLLLFVPLVPVRGSSQVLPEPGAADEAMIAYVEHCEKLSHDCLFLASGNTTNVGSSDLRSSDTTVRVYCASKGARKDFVFGRGQSVPNIPVESVMFDQRMFVDGKYYRSITINHRADKDAVGVDQEGELKKSRFVQFFLPSLAIAYSPDIWLGKVDEFYGESKFSQSKAENVRFLEGGDLAADFLTKTKGFRVTVVFGIHQGMMPIKCTWRVVKLDGKELPNGGRVLQNSSMTWLKQGEHWVPSKYESNCESWGGEISYVSYDCEMFVGIKDFGQVFNPKGQNWETPVVELADKLRKEIRSAQSD